MKKENQEIRDRLRVAGFPQWRLARQIGVSDGTLCLWLRVPLFGERQERVLRGLAELEREKG